MTKRANPPGIFFPVPGNGERTPQYDERFAAILKTAAQIIADEGYEKASMRKLASRAGVSIAGLYYYFKSKEEVLYLIQYYTFDSLVRNLKDRLDGASQEPAEARIRLVVENHLSHFLKHLPELKVCARELESLKGDAYKKVLEKRREYYRITRKLIDELSAGSRQRLDSDMAALALFGMLNWVYMWFNPRRHSDLKRLEEQLSGIFIDGIRPR
ncbi:TetR/AcrR family transcriptional regulator [Candidatus Eisenbacteria bacterium]|uniref:TetR/AcrR family transcriptional regulator n=1 Tax=Eiseniibacteriota bacterium TaxID=2212470 RepID=A0ABV6YJH7_UNCEI